MDIAAASVSATSSLPTNEDTHPGKNAMAFAAATAPLLA
jgi:hypothetical protein